MFESSVSTAPVSCITDNNFYINPSQCCISSLVSDLFCPFFPQIHLRSDISSAKSPCGWRQRAKRHWHTMRHRGSMKRAQIPAMM